jgi:hypothetical protein
MPRGKTYEEIKVIIENDGINKLLTTKEQFELEKIKTKTIPSQIKIEILCGCSNSYVTTFNQFSKGKNKCNDCVKRINKEKVYPETRIKEVVNLYINGWKMKDISKKLGMKSETVSKILKENNISIRNNTDYKKREELATNKKYKYNEDFFEEINTEKKAYWLGFLYADGSINKNKNRNGTGTKGGSVELSLKKEDEYHLFNFIQDIEGNIPVKHKIIKLNENVFEASRIFVNSVKMVEDLISHGCMPNKSLTLKFPTTVPEHLLRHFIRGYIDGDGCIFFHVYDEYDAFFVSMLGTYDFLTELKKYLENNGIKCNNVTKTKSRAFELKIYGIDNLVNLYNFLYDDASVFLGRKMDKFRQALMYFNRNFNISETAKLCCLLDDELNKKKFFKKHIRPLIRNGNFEFADLMKRVFDYV